MLFSRRSHTHTHMPTAQGASEPTVALPLLVPRVGVMLVKLVTLVTRVVQSAAGLNATE